MLTKSQYSFIKSLKQKKIRNELQLFIAEGSKLIIDLIANDNFEIQIVYATPSGIEKFDPKISKNLDIKLISETDMEKISGLSSSSDALAILKMQKPKEKVDWENWILLLDGIQDPGNFGTIIRTANWFGFGQIVCSLNTVDVYNPKVVQASMGSLGRVEVYYKDLETFLKSQRKPIYGTLLEGISIYDSKFPENGIFLFGSEGQGISENLIPYIHSHITIPKFGIGESLNVAIALGIVCSELRR